MSISNSIYRDLPEEPKPKKVLGAIRYRTFKRIQPPIAYPFEAAGGWTRQHNMRKKPIREARKAKRVRK